MANQVGVEIVGKETVSKAVGSVGTAFASLRDIMQGPVALFQMASNAVGSLVNSFAEAEVASVRLGFSIQNASGFTTGATERMKAFADEMKRVSLVDDDVILGLESKLIMEGKSEAQTKRLIRVALDYAAATGTDVASALEALDKSMEGQVRGSMKLIAGMSELTEQELKQGKAIDVVANATEGYAAKIADGTLQGSMKSAALAFDDLGKKAGEILAPALKGLMGFVSGILDSFLNLNKGTQTLILGTIAFAAAIGPVTSALKGLGNVFGYLEKHPLALAITAITTAVVGLAGAISELNPTIEEQEARMDDLRAKSEEILGPVDALNGQQKITEEQVTKLIALYPELDGVLHANTTTLAEAKEAQRQLNIEQQRDILNRQRALILAKEQQVADMEKAQSGFKNSDDARMQAMADSYNSTIEKARQELRLLNAEMVDYEKKMRDLMYPQDAPKPKDDAAQAQAAKASTKKAQQEKEKKEAVKAYSDSMQASLDAEEYKYRTGSENLQRQIDEANAAAEASMQASLDAEEAKLAAGAERLRYEEEIRALIEQEKRDLLVVQEARKKVAEDERSAYGGQTAYEAASSGNAKKAQSASERRAMQSAGANLAPLFQTLKFVGDLFDGLIKPLGSVNALMNWSKTILGGVMHVLGPMIDTLLNPLVGVLEIVGEMIGKLLVPVLNIVAPVIKALALGFAWLYNSVLLPIGNLLIGMFNGIQNIFVDVYNFFAWLFGGQQLQKVASNAGFLTTISLEDIQKAGASVSNPSGGSGGGGVGATYSQQRPIQVYVTVETAALVGQDGFREFALKIRDELQLAIGTA